MLGNRDDSLPLIEGRVFGVALERSFLDDKPHLLEERGRGGRRLSLKQDVDGPRNSRAQLTVFTARSVAAFRVYTVGYTVCM